MIRNDSRALMKLPYLKVLWLTVNVRLLKLGLPKMALMIGVMRSAISAWMTALNATPITTATARSNKIPAEQELLEALHYTILPWERWDWSARRSLRPYQRKWPVVRSGAARGASGRITWHRRREPVAYGLGAAGAGAHRGA